jgi:hypothetical protein
MHHLRVTLERGFEGEFVIVRTDGRDFPCSSVTASHSISIPLPTAETRRLSLEVEVPAKGVFGAFGLMLHGDSAVRVRLEPTGVLSFQIET